MPTPGKLELTIKINEFPASVKTLENGWKQFEIDTGEQIVTLTVKPKVFIKAGTGASRLSDVGGSDSRTNG